MKIITIKKGFTLIEILLTMGILSLLLITLTQVFGSIVSLRLKSDVGSTLSQDSRYVYSILEYDLNQATYISSPAMSTSGSTLIIQSLGETVTYSVDAGVLSRTQGTESAAVVTDSILSDFTVTRGINLDDLASVGVSYTLSTTATGDSPEQSRSYQTTFALRVK